MIDETRRGITSIDDFFRVLDIVNTSADRANLRDSAILARTEEVFQDFEDRLKEDLENLYLAYHGREILEREEGRDFTDDTDPINYKKGKLNVTVKNIKLNNPFIIARIEIDTLSFRVYEKVGLFSRKTKGLKIEIQCTYTDMGIGIGEAFESHRVKIKDINTLSEKLKSGYRYFLRQGDKGALNQYEKLVGRCQTIERW